MKNFIFGMLFVVAALIIAGGSFFIAKKAISDKSKNLTRQELVGADKDVHGCIGSAGYTWCEQKANCLRSWEEACTTNSTPSPTIDETELLKTTIKKALVAKHGDDANNLTITVSKVSGLYAKGMASAQGGGGLWFAAKTNGAWNLVWDGNGIINCEDLQVYPEFPTSFIPQCYDKVTDKMKTR